MKLKIEAIGELTPGIRKFTLAPVDGSPLPRAGAGSHVVLEIPGPNRVWKNAYSITTAADAPAYEIMVRRVEKSRGGSAWLHDHAKVGDVLEVSPPQNLFAPQRKAKRHLLLSAGIGITPFLSYLKLPGLAYEMHHCCKPDDEAAFRTLLPSGPQVTLHTSRSTLNLEALLKRQKLDTHLSVCGPESFMDVVLSTAAHVGWPAAKVHKESFGGATGGEPFVAHLKRSNVTVNVGREESLLDAMEATGLTPPCLCRGGACGECKLTVLDGVPAHHDHYLSETERAANNAIMICVSRAKTPELVLDF
ncbi:MAG: PDR/VanB family oxidoreductase [Acidocella sp.]|nr:PDR/VanB family oxidoreductase [Acidocella sp.]